jgi:phage gpG-like protein
VVSFEVNKTKYNKLIKKLEKVQGMNFDRPLRDTRKLLMKEIQENFDRQGALYQGQGFIRPGGAFVNAGRATTRRRAWSPLAPSTRAQRKRFGFRGARPILVQSGRLRRGFKAYNTKSFMKILNHVPYGKYHQTGTSKMPQRKIMGFTPKNKKAIAQIFKNYVHDLIMDLRR